MSHGYPNFGVVTKLKSHLTLFWFLQFVSTVVCSGRATYSPHLITALEFGNLVAFSSARPARGLTAGEIKLLVVATRHGPLGFRASFRAGFNKLLFVSTALALVEGFMNFHHRGAGSGLATMKK